MIKTNNLGFSGGNLTSHPHHNPLSVITGSPSSIGSTTSIHSGGLLSNHEICLECALSFLFDKSQLSLRKMKLLEMMKQLLLCPSSLAMNGDSATQKTINVDHIGPLLLSSCLKAILPQQGLKKQVHSPNVENNILEEVIQMWLDIVPTEKLLSRDFPLIVQMICGELEGVCSNFLCLLVDKIFRALQADDCWNFSIPLEAFSSLLTILINNFISNQSFNKAESEYKSDLLFIILKLCQIMQLHNDCNSILQSVWNGKPNESFIDTILACLLKAEDEDLHINSLALLHCLARFNKKDSLDLLSNIDYQRLIDALISVILSPNISIQIICNQLILEYSTNSQDIRIQLLKSDISDFLFEALSKDTTGEITPSIMAIFHSLFLSAGNNLLGSSYFNNFQELGIKALLKIFPSKVETFDHLTLSNNILSIFYMYYLNSVEFGLATPQSSFKDFQNNFCSLCERISNALVSLQSDVAKEMTSVVSLNFKTLCEICCLFIQQSLETSELMEHLSLLFCNILKSDMWDEFEDGLATFMICAIGLGRLGLSDSQQGSEILSKIDELILENVDLSGSNGLHDRFLRICHDYIHQRISQQKRPHILLVLMQKKFISLSVNSSGGMTLSHKQLVVQFLYSKNLLERPIDNSILNTVDLSPNSIVSMLRNDLIELGIALLHCTMFNNETITPLNTLFSTISTIILDKSLTSITTLSRLRLTELFVGLSLNYSFSTIPSTISCLVLDWYLECMKLTSFAFRERTSLFVKWASQQESTTPGIIRSLISGLISIQTTTSQNQPQESYLLCILKDARVDLVPTLVSLFMENSSSKNSTTQFLRLLSEYFSTETLIHEKDSTLVIQKIIEPTLSNVSISLKKGCNTNITSTLDEITKCTGIVLDYSKNLIYLSTIFNHYSKIFLSLSDLKLDLKSICLTMNILTKIIYLMRSDDVGVSVRLSSFQVKSNLTRLLQSVERLLVLFSSENNSSNFVISILQLVITLLRSMGTTELNCQIYEKLLRFTIEYLNHDSPLLRVLSSCTFHAILSTSSSNIDHSKVWTFNLVYSLLNNILSHEEVLSLYSIKALYLLEIKRGMSESILSQSMWNEFVVTSIVSDSRNEDIFRPSFIVYMCSIMWTCPPLFHQLFEPYFKRDFFKKFIDSAKASCINEWKSLVETFLSHPTLSSEDKLFISNYCFDCCSKLKEKILDSSSLEIEEASMASDIFLHPQLLYEISKSKEYFNVLTNMQQLLSKQYQQ